MKTGKSENYATRSVLEKFWVLIRASFLYKNVEYIVYLLLILFNKYAFQ